MQYEVSLCVAPPEGGRGTYVTFHPQDIGDLEDYIVDLFALPDANEDPNRRWNWLGGDPFEGIYALQQQHKLVDGWSASEDVLDAHGRAITVEPINFRSLSDLPKRPPPAKCEVCYGPVARCGCCGHETCHEHSCSVRQCWELPYANGLCSEHLEQAG